jgi:AAA family ATP:ADP antiporter
VAATETADSAPSKGLIERLLAPIAEVQPGEAVGVLLLTAAMFFLLSGYYLLKTAREIFILSEGGAEVKSYASAGQAVLLLILVPAYGAFASRVNRVQLVTWIPLFFAANVLLFVIAVRNGLQVGIVYFLWVGIFNVMVTAQFWAFATDLYTPEQGKRLFPLIGVGSSVGAWLGSVRAGQLVKTSGPVGLLLGGAVTLVVCVMLARLAETRVRRQPRAAAVAPDEPLGGGKSGFAMLLSDRYLLLIAGLILLLNVVNTGGEYLFGRYIVENAAKLYGAGTDHAAARGQFIGEQYSALFSHVNLIGFVLQLFVVSRLFKYLGVGRSLFIHPLVTGIGYLLMLFSSSFAGMRVLKTVDNSLDYSLGNTSKQALWLPTSRQAKYKAKQAVDSFVVRAGDVLSAVIVYAGELAAFAMPVFLALNLVLTVAWIAVVALLNRRLAAPRDQSAPL